MGRYGSRALVIFLMAAMLISSLGVGPLFLAAGNATAPAIDTTPASTSTGAAPPDIPASVQPPPTPNLVVNGQTLISYDDGQNGKHPALAVTPPGSNKPTWDGSMHAVWDEQNESDPYNPHQYEIHYSMSWGASGGRYWSNDKFPPGDRIISNTRKQGRDNNTKDPTYYTSDKVDPAIAIDMFGYIHVVWRQLYSDGSWEIMYSRSMDNGKSWTGFDGHLDKLVSYRAGGGTTESIPAGPSIAVSNNRDTGKVILHVVWAGWYPKGEQYEVFYSQSQDNGVTWSGATADHVISVVGQRADARSPVIATSTKFGEVVTAAWLQNDIDSKVDEIFATTSTDTGATWPSERIVSMKASDGLHAQAPTISGNIDFTIIAWAQPYKTGSTSEIMNSFTKDYGSSWSGATRDWRISRADGENATKPSISLAPNGRAYATWTERDQNAYKSIEVHVSETMDITISDSWTGLKRDQIISVPNINKYGVVANAGNVSTAIGYINGAWRAHAIWDEINFSQPAKNNAENVMEDNWEIIINNIVDCSAPVVSGWNLISVPMNQEYYDLRTVFNDGAGDGLTTWDRMMWYDPLSTTDHWKQYNINWDTSQNDITSIDLKKGVWINITNKGDGFLTLTGNAPSSTSISLYAGWNLVGYPAQDDSSYMVVDLKTATGATIVEGFRDSATYKTQVLVSDVVLKRGSAYWVYVPSDVVWTVNW